MDVAECTQQLELFEVGRRQVTMDFAGGQLTSDAGLLPVAELDRKLGLLAEAARLMPDPRSQLMVTHTAEQILRQQVFQILAGYPDGNDAQLLRNDPLLKTIVGTDPEDDQPLASGSTMNRFQNTFTRREAEKPLADRDVIFEVQRAKVDRIKNLNTFLIDTFVRTRLEQPSRVIIDLDPTDDTAHGHQQLTLWNTHYDQNQYFPMMIFEGTTGMPLGAWLRTGTAHASHGAPEMLKQIVDRLRQHWPEIKIFVRADAGLAMPEIYEYCEAAGLIYAIGFSTNEVLKRRVKERELEENTRLLWWIGGRRETQLFHSLDDYQAGTWSRPRRIIIKSEITKTGGANLRYVVTNMTELPADVYKGFYTQRGNVPERPIGELKNGLHMDRLSCHRFFANGQKLLVHVLAYLLYALFREANAKTPVLNTMEIGTARTRLFKVAALVEPTSRRIWFHAASHWPGRAMLLAATKAVSEHVRKLHERWRELNLFYVGKYRDPQDQYRIVFAPLPLK